MGHAPEIAVLIPCLNEQATIGTVIQAFRVSLRDAKIYVYDNGSSDDTVRIAKEHGAIVRSETRRGKGHVVRRMFADVEADLFLLVDGDGTYDASFAPRLVSTLIDGQYDMVVAARDGADSAYPMGHKFGNAVFSWITKVLFGRGLEDVFSGYRLFTRRFVKSVPVQAPGFDIETELNIHALDVRIPFTEVSAPYKGRPSDSHSKMRKFRDGFHILGAIGLLMKEARPLWFYGIFAVAFALLSLGLFYPVFLDYMATGLVTRLPTTVLSAALMILASLSLVCGLVLHSVSRLRFETRRVAYLRQGTPLCFLDAPVVPGEETD